MIGRAVAAALKVWLRSQLDHVVDLELVIESGDGRLSRIAQVHLTASEAVYQGIHLSHISVVAHHIEVNLKQVLRGKPLQLLQPVPINLAVSLPTEDLQKSLSAPMLKATVSQLLQTLLQPQLHPGDIALTVEQIHIEEERLILTTAASAALASGILRAGLAIGEPQQLCLYQLDWQWQDPAAMTRYLLEDYTIDLGPEINLQSLSLSPVAIACTGQITVQP